MSLDQTPSSSRLAHAFMRTTGLLTKQLWIWPLLAALILSGVGLWARINVERVVRNELSADLQTVLKADVTALRIWLREKQLDAKSQADDPRVRRAVTELIKLGQDPAHLASMTNSEAMANLKTVLKQFLEPQGYTDFVVVGRDGRILASLHDELIGTEAPHPYQEWLARVLDGRMALSRPYPSEVPLLDGRGRLREHLPTMLAAAPVNASNGVAMAALALRIAHEREFDAIFSVARLGQEGQAYAFDRNGLLLSSMDSRFQSQIRAFGLIPRHSNAVLSLYLRDPGSDLRRSAHSPLSLTNLPLTRMAAAATQGHNGIDIKGYRDIRGVPVVGAWAWLPEIDMGVATEVSAEEAYQPLVILRRAFLTIFSLLAISGVLIFGFTLAVKHLESVARKNALAARQLGQYVLLHEIGLGSSGRVYKARHAMLRRPVAIKLLDPDKTNKSTIARFEHEVQVTSQLTHPNTVSIYDYGSTPEGVFYYAMEFLNGFSLDKLAQRFGPQPESRVIHILEQVCGSLAEAHDVGLIHRDIKPANIILTSRGKLHDIAKVLDFGLVKVMKEAGQAESSAGDLIVGTPRYLSPEAIETPERVDCRSDLYSLGAVGYFLLTGKPLFDCDSLKELFQRQVQTEPLRPSMRIGKMISCDLEDLIMRCLAKDKEKRPQSAKELGQALSRCVSARQWTQEMAEQWWTLHAQSLVPEVEVTVPERTLAIAPRAE